MEEKLMGIYNSNYDFNKYKTFYAVAETKSFSKASELLHISQPAISYAIKELEETLKTKLFHRKRQGVELTDDGEKLMYYLQKAFSNIIKAERIITERAEESTGLVRIGIYSHISQYLLTNKIVEFKKLHPKAKFSVFQSSNQEMIEHLKRRDLDFVIMQYPVFLEKNHFKEEILWELPTCFYASKKIFNQYQNSSSSSSYPLILPFPGYTDIDSLEEKLKRHQIHFNTEIRSYSSETIKELVKKDLGIGWGLKVLIEKELKEKELIEFPLPIKNENSIYSISYDEDFLNQTAKEFLEFLKR